jgi:hypothetical protein
MPLRPLLPLLCQSLPVDNDKALDEIDGDADADFRIRRFY